MSGVRGPDPRGMLRPVEHVAAFRSRRPDVSKFVDPLRARRAEVVPSWPEWCFLTIPAAIHLLYEDLPTSPEQLDDVLELAAFAPWRVTQGIYRLDPAVFEEALDADLGTPISADLLMRLPQWCVYVETPGWRPYDMRAAGNWRDVGLAIEEEEDETT